MKSVEIWAGSQTPCSGMRKITILVKNLWSRTNPALSISLSLPQFMAPCLSLDFTRWTLLQQLSFKRDRPWLRTHIVIQLRWAHIEGLKGQAFKWKDCLTSPVLHNPSFQSQFIPFPSHLMSPLCFSSPFAYNTLFLIPLFSHWILF